MAKRADKRADDGGNSEPGAPNASDREAHGASGSASGDGARSEPIEAYLPMVVSPKLDAAESGEPADDDVFDEAAYFDAGEGFVPYEAESADEMASPAAVPAQPRSRFALLAAAIALVAALGSFVGTLSASGVLRFVPAPATASAANAGNVASTTRTELGQLAVIKSSLDGANRNTNAELAKLADRLDRVEHAQADPAMAAKLAHIADAVDRVEHAQTDPAGKLSHISDAVDKLDKQTAALSAAGPETTGSIASSAPPASAAKISDRVLSDWIVQDVRDGRAVVESRYGGVFVVGAGSVLPKLGPVQEVKRQEGRWVVVTASGLITESGR
jgi:hypothetical protein